MIADFSFARLLSEFGQSLGIAELAPTDEGLCQLVADGGHTVQLIHVGARDSVLLSCCLGEREVDAAQAASMVKANFLQAGRGAVLCQAPDGRPHIQLALACAECSAASLCAALEALLDQADRWRELLAQQAAPASAAGVRDPSVFLRSV